MIPLIFLHKNNNRQPERYNTWLSSDGVAVFVETCPPNYNLSTLVIFVSFGDFSSFEYIAFTLKAEPAILLLTLYRPPKLWADFLDQFSELMSLIITSYDQILVNGNFNIHMNKKTYVKAIKLLHILDSLQLKQHVTESTHDLGNTLDLFISRG